MAEFYQACISCRTSLKAPSVDGLCETCRTARTIRKSQPTDQPTKSFDPSLTRSAEPNRNDPPHVRRGLPPDPPGFTLHRELGHGGTAVVYLAKQHGTERECAIKYVQHFHLKSMRVRLEREVRALGRLDHPHILPIYQCSLDEAFPYFVMEYAPGGSLSDALKASPMGLPLDDAIMHLIALTEAVAVAHEAGIVHRDLKPGNLLLDREKKLKVADFGLARNLDSDPTITRTDAIIGTPAYMSPEQAKGETATAKSDIYGIGAVGYSLVTGKPPHGGTDHRKTLADVIAKDVVPPDWHRKDLPPHFSAILEKCLERNPSQRYPTAKDLLADFKALRDGKETVAQPLSTIGRVWKATKRQSRWAIAAVCLVAIGAIAAAVIPKRQESQKVLSQEKLTARLKAGQPVTLIDHERLRVESFTMFGDISYAKPEGVQEFAYSSNEEAAFGLVRSPGISRYRINAELRQYDSQSNRTPANVNKRGNDRCGILINAMSYPDGDRSVHAGRIVSFHEPIERDPFPRRWRMTHFAYTNDPLGTGHALYGGGTHLETLFQHEQPTPWRQIEISIEPDRVAIVAQGDRADFVPSRGTDGFATLKKTIASLQFNTDRYDEIPKESIGLISIGSWVFIRHMTITPLPESP